MWRIIYESRSGLTTIASQLAFYPPGSLLRHQQRLNLGEQGAAFGKCESQVGDAPVFSFHNSNGCCFSLTRFPTLQAGLDDQSLGNVASIADKASVLGGLAGLFSLEISQIPSAASHRVRRRLAVYDGGQVDGNGLPRFGSLSSTLFGEEIFRSRKSTNKLVVHRSILSRQVRHVLDHTIKVVVAGRIKVAPEP